MHLGAHAARDGARRRIGGPAGRGRELLRQVFQDGQRIPYLPIAVQQNRHFGVGAVGRQLGVGVGGGQRYASFRERQSGGLQPDPGPERPG